jgi:diguanylate cyclase (GGDEF)-like protein/PAS domain S-box-containing protein
MTTTDNRAIFAAAIAGAEGAAYCVDRTRRITAWNAAATDLTGYEEHEALGKRCWHNLLRHVDDRGHQLCRGLCPLVAAMEDGRPRHAGVYLHHKDGHRVPVQIAAQPILDVSGALVGAVETFHAFGRPQPPDELPVPVGDRDQLTGLPGLTTARLRLERWLAALRNGGHQFGLVRLGIDPRDQIVARFGVEAYDAIVRAVAATVAHAVRSGDVALRTAEDTFLVLVPDSSTRDIVAQANRLRFLIEQTFLVRGHRLVRVHVQAEAALGQPDDTPERLLARAGDGR